MKVSDSTLRDSVAMRWFALVLISMLTFSTYWFQDFFGGIKDLVTTQYDFTNENYGRILSFTSFANMFGMIIIGGIILDKWGIRLAGILFGGLAAVGGLVVYLGSIGFFGESVNERLWTMVIGRMMFGSGLEVVCVVATRTIVKWFKGYELALAMAINVGFGRLGSAMSIAVSGDIAGKSVIDGVTTGSSQAAVGFAASLLGLALIFFLIYLMFDIRLDKQQAKNKISSDEPEEEFRFSDLLELLKDKAFIYITLLCVTFYAAVFPFIQYASDLLVNKFQFTDSLSEEGIIRVNGSAALGSILIYAGLFIFTLCFSVIPNNIKNKSRAMMVRLFIFLLFIVCVYPLRHVFSIWLHNGPKTASLIPLGTIIFTPIFANIVDKKGKAASLMMLGSTLLIFAHLSLSLFDNIYLGYLGLICLGVAFSLIPAAMWPSVAKIVPEHQLGTAYAFMFTIQNWGLAAFFWGIGAVLDWANADKLNVVGDQKPVMDYTIPIFILVFCGVISIFLSYKLKKADQEYGYNLEGSEK